MPPRAVQDGVALGQLSSGGSPSRMRWQIAPSCRAWTRVNRSKTNSRTASTCEGAASFSWRSPARLRTARVYRLSSASGCRDIQPRFSRRPTAWDNRGSELPVSVASTLIRSFDRGASDRRARIRYSNWLIPNSRCSCAPSTGCNLRIIVDSCAQTCCSCASSHRVSFAALMPSL
jgi:hypothetical protein